MPAIPYERTAVKSGPWDGPAQESALDNDLPVSVLRQEYAYVRPGIDPHTKQAYAVPHHEVVDGRPGAANMEGCREGLSRIKQIRPALTPSDVQEVRAHLVKHLSDGQRGGNAVINEAVRRAAGRGT